MRIDWRAIKFYFFQDFRKLRDLCFFLSEARTAASTHTMKFVLTEFKMKRIYNLNEI